MCQPHHARGSDRLGVAVRHAGLALGDFDKEWDRVRHRQVGAIDEVLDPVRQHGVVREVGESAHWASGLEAASGGGAVLQDPLGQVLRSLALLPRPLTALLLPIHRPLVSLRNLDERVLLRKQEVLRIEDGVVGRQAHLEVNDPLLDLLLAQIASPGQVRPQPNKVQAGPVLRMSVLPGVHLQDADPIPVRL